MSTFSPAPAGYHSVQPYLIVNDAAAAIEFYKRALGATERMRMAGPDGRIMHAELVFGDSCVMLADEHPGADAYSPSHFGGSPVKLMIYVADCDATYKTAIAEGATSTREPADQNYGDRNAGIADPFGYTWFVATHLQDMSKEELETMASQ
jgi:PhnB protein